MGVSDERPAALGSTTQRLDTGWGRIYVTVSRDDAGEPFEVFVTTGPSGGLFNAQAEAIGKLLSAGLRMSSDREAAAEEFARSLLNIRSDKKGVDNGDTVHSIPDAVGIALYRELRGERAASIKDRDDVPGDDG